MLSGESFAMRSGNHGRRAEGQRGLRMAVPSGTARLRLARGAERARPAVALAAEMRAHFVDQLAQRLLLLRRRSPAPHDLQEPRQQADERCPCLASSRSTAAATDVERRREVVDPELDELAAPGAAAPSASASAFT